MLRNDVIMPALACALLGAGAVVQMALPSGAKLPDDPMLAPRRVRPVAVAPLPAYPLVLASPIFAPDRKGVTDAASDDLRVLGIATGGRSATVVVKATDGATQILTPGQSIKGWRLVSVDRAHAVFERNGDRRVLGVSTVESPTIKPAASSEDDE